MSSNKSENTKMPKSRSTFYVDLTANTTLHRNTFEDCAGRMTELKFSPQPLRSRPAESGSNGEFGTETNNDYNSNFGKRGSSLEPSASPSASAFESANSSSTFLITSHNSGNGASTGSKLKKPTVGGAGENVSTEGKDKSKKNGGKRPGTFRRLLNFAANGCSSDGLQRSDCSDNEKEKDCLDAITHQQSTRM